jgi:hypothetical protein
MEMHHKGAIVRPIITNNNKIFSSSVVIRREDGTQEIFDALGRFASANAAKLFAVDWAIAYVEEAPLPRPPFKML